ncbi:MAG: hypothetical protein RMK32_04075 [Anaerolineae bacterium]|nr:hypothetical protein [Anaerolineae bacterium]
MKRLWMLAIMMMAWAGCGGSAAPGSVRCNENLCVKIEVAEPIRWGEPITVMIVTTTDRDITDLGISIYVYPSKGVVVEGPENWEGEAKSGMVYEGGAGWRVTTKTGQPITFTRVVHLPQEEGVFKIMASATTIQGMRVTDSVYIYVGREGGVVNPTPDVLPGTPALVPTAPPEWRLTPFPTSTPWPTPFPTPTSPVPEHTPTPTQLPPLISPVVPPTPAASP